MEMLTTSPENNGALRLPPIGFRFLPTDEELLVHYLTRKNCSLPLPASVIPEFDVFQTNPWDLPGDLREKRYFFSRRKDYIDKRNRVTFAGCGYWKVIAREKLIVCNGSKRLHVGIKKRLAFYQGKCRTSWLMYQYHYVVQPPSSCFTQNLITQSGDWIVCLVFQKKKQAKKQQQANREKNEKSGWIEPDIIDFMIEDNASSLGPPPAYT